MTTEKRTFFRPHPRVQEKGLLNGKALPSMTKQEFLQETDINNILKQYSQSGMIKHMRANAEAGGYQDLPDPQDFQDSLHQVEAARASFMSLPSRVRARFENDPVQFLEFVADPANAKELVDLGLAIARPADPPLTSIDVETPPADPGKTPAKA